MAEEKSDVAVELSHPPQAQGKGRSRERESEGVLRLTTDDGALIFLVGTIVSALHNKARVYRFVCQFLPQDSSSVPFAKTSRATLYGSGLIAVQPVSPVISAGF